MARSLPPPPPSPTIITAARRRTLLDLEISVVTPLFGGGAVPRESDPEHPVRAASVRGHLRFWWRACRSTAFATADELFTAETRLWGSTDTPSAVDVQVTTLDHGTEVPCAEYVPKAGGGFKSFPVWKPDYPSYALFPFQGKLASGGGAIEVPPAFAREKVRFRLRVAAVGATLSEAQRQEIKAAVWAWLTFGGIGARTRRGCGSLYPHDSPFTPPTNTDATALTNWLHQQAGTYLAHGNRQLPIPTLTGAAIVAGLPGTPKQSWMTAINVLQRLRQGVGVGRNPPGTQPNRPGRSRWPEADSIRRLTGIHAPNHEPEHEAGLYFPRADLGLPIIFHFQSAQDPRDATLQTDADERASRMASPLILKPLATAVDRAVPLALCLNAPRLWEMPLDVQLKPRSGTIPATQLNDPALSNKVSPLRLTGKGVSARKAFMEFARSEWHNAPLVALP